MMSQSGDTRKVPARITLRDILAVCSMCSGTGERPGYSSEDCRVCQGAGYRIAQGTTPDRINSLLLREQREAHQRPAPPCGRSSAYCGDPLCAACRSRTIGGGA